MIKKKLNNILASVNIKKLHSNKHNSCDPEGLGEDIYYLVTFHRISFFQILLNANLLNHLREVRYTSLLKTTLSDV